MNNRVLSVGLCITLISFVSGCSDKNDMTPEEIAVSHEKSDMKKIREAEKMIEDGKTGERESSIELMQDIFNATSDRHLVTSSVAESLEDLSIKAISEDIKHERAEMFSIYQSEIDILRQLELMRSEDETLKEVHTAFTDELRKEYFQDIEKIGEKYEDYQRVKDSMPVPEPTYE